jgi:hypothetical protein
MAVAACDGGGDVVVMASSLLPRHGVVVVTWCGGSCSVQWHDGCL